MTKKRKIQVGDLVVSTLGSDEQVDCLTISLVVAVDLPCHDEDNIIKLKIIHHKPSEKEEAPLCSAIFIEETTEDGIAYVEDHVDRQWSVGDTFFADASPAYGSGEDFFINNNVIPKEAIVSLDHYEISQDMEDTFNGK